MRCHARKTAAGQGNYSETTQCAVLYYRAVDGGCLCSEQKVVHSSRYVCITPVYLNRKHPHGNMQDMGLLLW